MGLYSSFVNWAKDLGKSTLKTNFFFPLNAGYFGTNRESESTIIEAGYIQNGNIYSIVRKVAMLVSRLDYKIEINENEIESGEFYDLLTNPNKQLGRREYINKLVTYLLLTGDAFSVADQEAIGFNEFTLIPLPSQLVECKRFAESFVSPIKEYRFEDNGVNRVYDPEQVIHIQNFDPSYQGAIACNGLSPIQAGNLLVRASNNANIAEATTFENGAVSTLISSRKGGMTLTPNDTDKLDQANRERLGGAHKTGSVVSITGEANVTKIGSTPKEMGIPEERVALLREICNLFGVNSSEFNDPSNKTFASSKEARKSMYSDVVIPLFDMIMEAHVLNLAPKFNIDPFDIRIKVDTDKIEALNPDPVAIREHNLKMYESGAISREKFLELENIEDDGKEFKTQPSGQGEAEEV